MSINIIKGAIHTDKRGKVIYINNFDMREVKRMYIIHHINTDVKRGWRGHKLEQRWFFVTKGKFKLTFVKIDNWEAPNHDLSQIIYELTATEANVLHVLPGYASCLQALESDSTVLVYGNAGIDEANLDNYQYDESYFNKEVNS